MEEVWLPGLDEGRVHGWIDTAPPREGESALVVLHRWLPVAGAGHNDLLNFRELWRGMGEFLGRS